MSFSNPGYEPAQLPQVGEQHSVHGAIQVHARMVEAATLAHIHEFIVSTPNGYSTECGERGMVLSGGQKQRVAIARAFFRRPKVLILDEPTSALDAESEARFQDTLRTFAVGRTVLLITHRLDMVVNANRIIVLEGGYVVQHGTHEELMCDGNATYRKLWDARRTCYNTSKKQTINGS